MLSDLIEGVQLLSGVCSVREMNASLGSEIALGKVPTPISSLVR